MALINSVIGLADFSKFLESCLVPCCGVLYQNETFRYAYTEWKGPIATILSVCDTCVRPAAISLDSPAQTSGQWPAFASHRHISLCESERVGSERGGGGGGLGPGKPLLTGPPTHIRQTFLRNKDEGAGILKGTDFRDTLFLASDPLTHTPRGWGVLCPRPAPVAWPSDRRIGATCVAVGVRGACRSWHVAQLREGAEARTRLSLAPASRLLASPVHFRGPEQPFVGVLGSCAPSLSGSRSLRRHIAPSTPPPKSWALVGCVPCRAVPRGWHTKAPVAVRVPCHVLSLGYASGRRLPPPSHAQPPPKPPPPNARKHTRDISKYSAFVMGVAPEPSPSSEEDSKSSIISGCRGDMGPGK